MDRIDLHVETAPLSYEELAQKTNGENSAAVRERVVKARMIQVERFSDVQGVHSNAQMNAIAEIHLNKAIYSHIQ